jgi:hypothetical protein
LVSVVLVVIKFLKPKSPPIQLPVNAADPAQPQPSPKEHHSPSFDLGIVRVSLLIDVVCYALMGLAPTPIAFVFFSLVGSTGMGFSPAAQSVALELYFRRGERETGRLFGAMSILQALRSA